MVRFLAINISIGRCIIHIIVGCGGVIGIEVAMFFATQHTELEVETHSHCKDKNFFDILL